MFNRRIILASAVGLALVGCPAKSPQTKAPAAATDERNATAATKTLARAGDQQEGTVATKPKKNAEGLVVEVEMINGPRYGADAPVTVKVTVTNPTAEPRTFCDYHTPFEGIRNNIFILKDSTGAELDYRGMMAKRAPPGADNYVTLAPGAAKRAEVDIRKAYTLPPGKYTIAYRGTGISGLGDSNSAPFEITR